MRLAVIALAAAVMSFTLRGAALTGSAQGMADPEILALLWQTQAGGALILRIAAGGLLLAGLCIPGPGQWIALAGAGAGLWSLTQIGHISGLEQTGVRLLLMLHLAGAAFWIGILSPLRSLSRQPKHLAGAAHLGHRFGQAAAVIVPVLILAGLLMAWLLAGGPAELFNTGYGQTLLVKLGLVGGLLGLAAVNKTRFVPAMQAGDALAGRRLARSIEAEKLILLAILAATATLTSVLPLPH
ncbi:copper resistance D family protein [Leisingera sp. ANG59]|uniref:copper resistance D family protein n=1 Tax=Leisingera sp. ANG59 TaxID=2675221 RepID=UPI0020C69134|nr:CopD family protein [Leisingera sp. ANG59]